MQIYYSYRRREKEKWKDVADGEVFPSSTHTHTRKSGTRHRRERKLCSIFCALLKSEVLRLSFVDERKAKGFNLAECCAI